MKVKSHLTESGYAYVCDIENCGIQSSVKTKNGTHLCIDHYLENI